MDWSSFLTTLTSVVVGGGLFTWLAKKIFQYYLDQDVEKFKSDLKMINDREIEQLKSSLNLEAQKQVFRYTSLHAERAQLIADLYQKLTNINRLIEISPNTFQLNIELLHNIPEKIEEIDESDKSKMHEFISAVSDLADFYGPKKIYFGVEISKRIDDFIGAASFIGFVSPAIELDEVDKMVLRGELLEDIWNTAKTSLPETISILEKEFRILLGVN